jgi:hypothetical protein
MVMLSGETCEVVRVDPHRVLVKKGTGRDWVIRADDLTLVDASEPFDLEKFKAGRDALTRDGERAKFGGHNPDADECHRAVGWIDGEAKAWAEDGSYLTSGDDGYDLVAMAPETKVVWLNIYEDGEVFGYDSKDEADESARFGMRLGGKAHRVEVEL